MVSQMDKASHMLTLIKKSYESADLDESEDVRFFKGHVALKDMYGAKIVEDMKVEQEKIQAERKELDKRAEDCARFRERVGIDESW